MGSKDARFRSSERSRIRHQALQMASQLPENPHEALRILDVTRQLVIDGMGIDGEAVADVRVVRLPR
jgi:hypothetical protein